MTAAPPTAQPSLQPYPEYRPSGAPHLGDIPAHWGVAALKHLCSEPASYGMNVPSTMYQDAGVRLIRTTDITDEGGLAKEGGVFLPEETGRDRLLSNGDILLSRSGTVGRSFLYDADLHGKCAYAGYLVRFAPSALLLPKYLFYFTKTQSFDVFLRMSAISTTIENVNANKYANLRLPLPPPEEQAAISRWLDEALARVRQRRAANARMLDLLRECRRAAIHEAVTRGLNPAAPLRPQDAQPLGGVPAHWDIRRLKHWVGINERALPETTDPSFEFQYIEIGEVGVGTLVGEPACIRFAAAPSRARRIVRAGDTIISTVRTYLKAVWFAENVNDATICSTGFATLTPRAGTSPKFVSYLAQSDFFTDRVTAESEGIAYPAISESKFRSIHVPVPPPDEQAAIAARLDRMTAAIDAAADRANREITLLDEYAAALAAAAVTGKVDLRGAALRPSITS